MIRPIARIEDLPDRPVLDGGRYMPAVDLWRDVRWSLTPARSQVFPSDEYSGWPGNYRPVPIDAAELLAPPDARPAVLLVGCSYIAGDYLSNPERLIYRLRARMPGASVSCVAASGGGLVTNLAHIARFLPPDYQPDVVVLAPTQSWRQYIPESTMQFNSSPYGLWQHYYWFNAQPARKQADILAELCRRDCLRMDYLVGMMYPRATVLLVLFDAAGTGEMSLLRPQERAALADWARRYPGRVRILFDPDEMERWYRDLGPFDKKHPNAAQIDSLASRVAECVGGWHG